jgi:hypothetical protein
MGTVNPTSQPTRQPTRQPTSQPSGRPSKSPSTSRPTRHGATNYPSSRPSSSPTFLSDNYATNPFYIDFNRRYQNRKTAATSLVAANSETRQLLYGYFNYRGYYKVGGCSEWQSFINSNALLSSRTAKFTSITFETVKFKALTSQVLDNETVTCRVTGVDSFVKSLAMGSESSLSCGSTTLRVQSCPSAAPMLCAGCAAVCGENTCPSSDAGILVNPCMSCNADISVYNLITLEYQVVDLYPKFLAPLSIASSTSRQVNVSVSVSHIGSGTVYCAAVLPTQQVSVFAIRSMGFYAAIPAPNISGSAVTNRFNRTTEVIIDQGVSPSTEYSVLCYTEDSMGHAMPLAAVIAAKINVTTACCKSVTYLTKHSLIVDSVSNPNPFVFAVDHPVQANTYVNMKLVAVQPCKYWLGKGQQTGIARPASFLFTNTSTSFTGMYVITGAAGCYKVVTSVYVPALANVSSMSVKKASSLYFLPNQTFSTAILSTAMIAPPPSLQSAVITSNGLRIVISFDAATDQGSTMLTNPITTPFLCSVLFTFSPSAAGAVCTWLNQLQVSVLGASAILQKNGTISLNSRTVRSSLCIGTYATDVMAGVCLYSNATNVTVDWPVAPELPVASLVSAAVVSACDSLVLDPTLTTGRAGKSWASLTWSVSASVVSNKTSSLASFLNTNYRDTLEAVVVPAKYLVAGASLTISLTVSNYLASNHKSIASTTVAVVAEALPQLSLRGSPTTIVMPWSSALAVAASVTAAPAVCVYGSPSASTLSFAWNMYSVDVDTSATTLLTGIQSLSSDARAFKLSSYSLSVLATYILEVVLTSTPLDPDDSVLVSKASITVVVRPRGINASITGGIARSVSTYEDNYIDASTSVDLDEPSNTLSFVWTCVQVYPTYGGVCGSLDKSYFYTSTVFVPANFYKSQKKRSATFTVTVSNSYGETASASSTVTFLLKRVPVVTIIQPPYKLNPGTKNVIIGTVSTFATSDIMVTWSSATVPSSSQLATLIATPLNSTMAAGVYSSNFQLAILPDALAGGATYQFSISAAATATATATAQPLHTHTRVCCGCVTHDLYPPGLSVSWDLNSVLG